MIASQIWQVCYSYDNNNNNNDNNNNNNNDNNNNNNNNNNNIEYRIKIKKKLYNLNNSIPRTMVYHNKITIAIKYLPMSHLEVMT